MFCRRGALKSFAVYWNSSLQQRTNFKKIFRTNIFRKFQSSYTTKKYGATTSAFVTQVLFPNMRQKRQSGYSLHIVYSFWLWFQKKSQQRKLRGQVCLKTYRGATYRCFCWLNICIFKKNLLLVKYLANFFSKQNTTFHTLRKDYRTIRSHIVFKKIGSGAFH